MIGSPWLKKATTSFAKVAAVTAAFSLLCGGLSPASAKHCPKPAERWLAGDFHQHTLYTDGSTSFDFVMEKDNEFGLDWWANSEHGGSRNRDGDGVKWLDTTKYPVNPILGDNAASGNMWRWQSLRDFVFPDILDARALYPDKRIFSGLEWNVPGHEHCSTAIVAKDAGAISAFEYQFDKSDTDKSRTGEVTPYGILAKQNGRDPDTQATKPLGSDRHADAVAACKWMEEQYKAGTIDNGWIIFAHIERAGVFKTGSSDGGYNIEHFRDFNNAAPDVCFGFEGAPGHQVNDFRGLGNKVTCVDGVCTSSDFGGTYGGVGYYTAKVGGLWDALLGEGRHWFNYANSDYHTHWTAGGDDFYPGEYQKTYVHVIDKNRNGEHDPDEIADGLRSGDAYFVHGDLIDHLEFSAQSRMELASMGGTLRIKDRYQSREPLVLTIKFKSPSTNNCVADGTFVTSCPAPVVDHIDLIAGKITGKVDSSSPDYTKATNETTKVIATFTADDWRTDRQGYNVISYRIKDLDDSMYFRLRGTNVPVNTPHETDEAGNPLPDALVTLDKDANGVRKISAAQEAWNDLWFYSNPIFVYVK
jgi:hypothetical protein